jgi:hypothetical protein
LDELVDDEEAREQAEEADRILKIIADKYLIKAKENDEKEDAKLKESI